MFYYYGWMMIPVMILVMFAQGRVKSNYNKYAKVRNSRGLTGAQVADEILRSNNLYHVKVIRGQGVMSDHYDPRNETVTLSPHVYDQASISASSIAAHECGHAVQHAVGYGPMAIRSIIAPPVAFASKYVGVLVFAGIAITYLTKSVLVLDLAIMSYIAIALFQIVTLPVEFNASSRAIHMMTDYGLLTDEDVQGTKKVLNAAAFTYVAAMLTTLVMILRLVAVRGRR